MELPVKVYHTKYTDNTFMKFNALVSYLKRYKKPLLALSGGLDSSFLAFALSKTNTLAETITLQSSLFPKSELRRASRISHTFDLPHTFIDIENLHLKTIQENPEDRCYICKKVLFEKINSFAKENGFDVVLDGTTYDDQFGYRPGLKAKTELGVVSPIAVMKIRKSEIREICREHRLDFADLPSFSCFATRFPYHTLITAEKIKRVAQAEEFIKEKGFIQVRVRSHGTIARIEVNSEEFSKFLSPALHLAIVDKLTQLGFTYITLDLAGFKSGSMDKNIVQEPT